MTKPTSLANHRVAHCALHPTYCCSIDTTAINQPTQMHWLTAAVIAHILSTEKLQS